MRTLTLLECEDLSLATILDVDGAFLGIAIPRTPIVSRYIELIDNAVYDGQLVIAKDTGITYPITDLSTSCKAAILLELLDRPIFLDEVGENGIDAIFRYGTKGHLVMRADGKALRAYTEPIVPVLFMGETWGTILEINDLLDWRYFAYVQT